MALLFSVVLYKDLSRMQDVCAALPQNTDSARGYTICTAVKFPSGESFFDYITFPDAVTGGEYDAVVLVYAELVA